MREKEKFQNPIDKDKVAENPWLLPYAHNTGSAVVKPTDKSKILGRSMSSMYEQTDQQLSLIKEQIELLAKQAKDIQDRKSISEKIYDTKLSFKPLISKVYYLYQRKKEDYFLSMVAPDEWKKSASHTYVAKAKLLSDHTWEIQDKNENLFDDFLTI